MAFCNIPGGRLHYTHNGVKTSGPHLVLIHGAGGEVRCWPATWRLAGAAQSAIGLAITHDPNRITNHSIYAIDLPGHGRSPGPAKETIGDLADVIEHFLDAEDLTNVVLAGHSLGGAIALTVAARKNPRVIGQVIVASAAKIGVTEAILDGLQTEFEKTVDFIVKYSFDRASGPFFAKKAREYTIATGPTATHADFLACTTVDLRDKLDDIRLPTLVIAAENDRMIPHKHSASLAEGLPNARLESFADCGHYPHLDRTTRVEVPIAQFCAELQRPT